VPVLINNSDGYRRYADMRAPIELSDAVAQPGKAWELLRRTSPITWKGIYVHNWIDFGKSLINLCGGN